MDSDSYQERLHLWLRGIGPLKSFNSCGLTGYLGAKFRHPKQHDQPETP